MDSFSIISKLMLLLGIVGGVYTVVYGFVVWKSNPKERLGGSAEAKTSVQGEGADSE